MCPCSSLMLYFKPLFFYHMQDSASQQLKPKRLFLLYWSAEPLPDVLLQLDLSYQVPKIDHTQLDCLATLLSSSKCSFKKSFYKLTKSSCHMPWCVFASIEWKELLNKNNCWSPPPSRASSQTLPIPFEKPGQRLPACCRFYSIMLSHRRWRGPQPND